MDFNQDTFCNLLFKIRKLFIEGIKPYFKILYRHLIEFTDMLSANLHIQSFFTQAVTFTIRAQGSPPVTTQQYPVLNFVEVLFYFFKKIIYAVSMFISFP